MSFNVWLENRTPFAAATHLQVDAAGQEVLVAMFSASFQDHRGDGVLEPAAEQLNVHLGDTFNGDPALSSTRYEADIVPRKVKAEVLAVGAAYAPEGRPVREMQVGLKVGQVGKVLNISGDRIYDGIGYSDPFPFERMPILYERAYGGTTREGDCEQRNPVGIGYKQSRSADAAVKTHAPNITYPGEVFASPSDRPRPAGFGVLSRGWLPRQPLAGTCDDNWLQTQWPLPPKDTDPYFHQSAPKDQWLDSLAPGTPVTVLGMSSRGRWDFRLPAVLAPISLIYSDRVESVAFEADTLILEPDLDRITLKSRLAIVTRRQSPALREIVFGRTTPAYRLARQKGKAHLDLRGAHVARDDRTAWRQ